MKKLLLNGNQLQSGDPTLVLNKPWTAHPSMQITATTAGDLKWVYLALPLHIGDSIKEVTLSYQNAATRSFISQVRINQQTTPDFASVYHDDGTDLTSTLPTSHTSVTGGIVVTGSAVLELRLNFAKAGDVINIGAIEIGYQPAP